MGLIAVPAALTDHGSRYAILTVDGTDLLLQPTGSAPNRYGVAIETIIAIERGPAGVSELQFTVEDPLGVLNLRRNAPVYFTKTAESIPVFQGFVTSWTPRPQGTTGKAVEVRCSGLEIVLDWAKVAAVTIPAGTAVAAAVQVLVGMVLDGLAFPLNSLVATGDQMGNYAGPIGTSMVSTTIGDTDLDISAGTTLREAIRTVLDDATPEYAPATPETFYCTVDSLGGLRVFPATRLGGGVESPGGFADLFVVDAQSSPADGSGTVGSPMVASSVRYENDATAPVAVYVVGSGVSALVGDSTGDRGDLAVITDTTLTTVAQCAAAGRAYLAKSQQQLRASFDLLAKTPQPTLRAGSVVTFTDSQVGAAAAPLRLWEIARRFFDQREDWSLTVGGTGAPSHVVEMRRLTRGILS